MATATDTDRDTEIHNELTRIEELLTGTREALDFMLAFRILEAGHASNLGQAMRIARDHDQVRALFDHYEDDGG